MIGLDKIISDDFNELYEVGQLHTESVRELREQAVEFAGSESVSQMDTWIKDDPNANFLQAALGPEFWEELIGKLPKAMQEQSMFAGLFHSARTGRLH